MLHFLTANHDTITLIIALAGFFMSLGQILYGLYSKRTNISLEIENVELSSRGERKRKILTLSICNNSSAPIIITRIFLIDRLGKEHPCLLIHRFVNERYYPKFEHTDIPLTERFLSADFPICLAASQAALELVIFELQPSVNYRYDDTHVKLKVVTNKRTVSFLLAIPHAERPTLAAQ